MYIGIYENDRSEDQPNPLPVTELPESLSADRGALLTLADRRFQPDRLRSAPSVFPRTCGGRVEESRTVEGAFIRINTVLPITV